MSAIHEGDSVRLLGAYRYGDMPDQWLPAGETGRVVDVHGQGQGLAVEFTLRAPVFGPSGQVLDYGKFELGYFGIGQVTPAS